MNTTLIIWRGLHFAATIAMCGVLFFRRVIFDPAEERCGDYRLHVLDCQMKRIFWVGLALAFVSGGGWFLVVSAAIDDRHWREALSDGTALTVLTELHFGRAWAVRAVIGASLAVLVAFAPRQTLFQMLLAVIFAACLAFGGHGASTSGVGGDIHLAADMLHLTAVSAWLGGLIPFAVYLRSIDHDEPQAVSLEAQRVVQRFSILGILAVLTIIATGILNMLNFVSSAELLASTDYGRLLLLKLVLFLAMLAVAAFNRHRLVPELTATAAKTLRRNSFIEAAFGFFLLAVVALLGTLPPPLGNSSQIRTFKTQGENP